MARPKRKDKTRTVLRTGELQRSDGSYQYSWTDENHKRRYVYSKTLEALRIKEEAIVKGLLLAGLADVGFLEKVVIRTHIYSVFKWSCNSVISSSTALRRRNAIL